MKAERIHSGAGHDSEAMRSRALEHLWMHSAGWAQMAEAGEPLIMVEADGARVTDSRGRRWIDVNGGYASVNAGYGREELARAAYDQARRIHFFPQRTTCPPTVNLAAKLAAITPGDLSRSFLVSGGSEANDTSLKIVRAALRRRGERGRYRIVSRRGSYHGGSLGVLWLGAPEDGALDEYGPRPPGLLYAPQPHFYRCAFGSQSAEQCAARCVEATEKLILENGPETVAALIAEPIPITPRAGAAVPHDSYWPMLRDVCDRHGVLLVADEVVTGFGRTGRMFGIEHWGVVPDVMTVAKGLSSTCMPLGATIVRKDIADLFATEDTLLRHVFTAAGHPVAAAVGLKNLEIIEREKLVENAAGVGAYFKQRLEALTGRHAIIGDVRGLGLLLAVEIVADRKTKAPFPPERRIADELEAAFRKRGLLLRAGGGLIMPTPPLCVTRDDIDEIVDAMDEALSEVALNQANK